VTTRGNEVETSRPMIFTHTTASGADVDVDVEVAIMDDLTTISPGTLAQEAALYPKVTRMQMYRAWMDFRKDQDNHQYRLPWEYIGHVCDKNPVRHTMKMPPPFLSLYKIVP